MAVHPSTKTFIESINPIPLVAPATGGGYKRVGHIRATKWLRAGNIQDIVMRVEDCFDWLNTLGYKPPIIVQYLDRMLEELNNPIVRNAVHPSLLPARHTAIDLVKQYRQSVLTSNL